MWEKWILPLRCYLVGYKQIKKISEHFSHCLQYHFYPPKSFFIYWEKVNMKHEFIFPNPVHVREYGSFFVNVGISIYCSNSIWKIHVYLNILVFYHYVYICRKKWNSIHFAKKLIIMWYEILLENLMIPFQKCV